MQGAGLAGQVCGSFPLVGVVFSQHLDQILLKPIFEPPMGFQVTVVVAVKLDCVCAALRCIALLTLHWWCHAALLCSRNDATATPDRM